MVRFLELKSSPKIIICSEILFFPLIVSIFFKLVDVLVARYIAMITKQKAFNKSLVDQNTQVIFMDEAHVNLLDPDDWKILTQGGLTAHDRKYKKSHPAVIRCPMFITCQEEMNFGEQHNAAMEARLRKFYFRSLNSPPISGVQKSLRDNAMDCLVWACNVAVTPDDELPPPMPGSDSKPHEVDDDEKQRIRAINLDSESDQETSEQGELMAEEGTDIEDLGEEEADSDTESTQSRGWVRTLETISKLQDLQPCHSLKNRQLGLIAAGVKRARKERKSEAQRAKERILEEQRQHWIALGMIRQEDAHLLETVQGPYHPTIERSRDEYFAKKKEEEQKMLEETAAKYYENEWVWAKEKELRQLQEQEDEATDMDVKRALQYMIGVTVEALKLHFKRDQLPGLLRLVITERRKRAMDRKWLSIEQAQRVTSVWAPMPYPFDGSEEQDQEIFITPSSQASTSSRGPSQRVQGRNSKKRPAQTSTPVPKKGRITHFFTPSQQ